MQVGRNDPCPCGSGQKYKKCCLAKDDAARSAEIAAAAQKAKDAATAAAEAAEKEAPAAGARPKGHDRGAKAGAPGAAGATRQPPAIRRKAI